MFDSKFNKESSEVLMAPLCILVYTTIWLPDCQQATLWIKFKIFPIEKGYFLLGFLVRSGAAKNNLRIDVRNCGRKTYLTKEVFDSPILWWFCQSTVIRWMTWHVTDLVPSPPHLATDVFRLCWLHYCLVWEMLLPSNVENPTEALGQNNVFVLFSLVLVSFRLLGWPFLSMFTFSTLNFIVLSFIPAFAELSSNFIVLDWRWFIVDG